MVFDIITDLNALSERCDEIDPQKENSQIRKIVSGLKDTIKANGLLSLSAPQIGFKKRVFVIKYGEDALHAYINPVVTNVVGLDVQRETCPSLPNKTFLMPRNVEIYITYQTPLGDIKNEHLVGLASRVFLHEFDHLEGVNISDIGLELDDDFDDLSEEDRLEIIREYLESLDIREKQIKDEIENSPILKQISDGVKFMESVKKGETKVSAVTVSDEDQLKIIENNKKLKEMQVEN